MCLDPKQRINPTKRFRPLGGSAYIHYKCGKCAECRAEFKDEWSVRCYSEYEDCRVNGGYTLFDTLTYNEDCVPRFCGMRVFDPEHIRQFRSTLRDKIRQYHRADGSYPYYFTYKDNFKIIVVSEYGGSTHRPHYHLLAHCKVPNLPPVLLSKLIRDSWPHGNCDLRCLDDRIVDGPGALNYVSKYICKDDDFIETLEKTINDHEAKLPQVEFYRIFTKDRIKKIKGFHRQSNGYGLSILTPGVLYANPELSLFQDGCICMPDRDQIVKQVKIPQYIMRKLYYDLVEDHEITDDDGKPLHRWVLNETGIQFKAEHLSRDVDHLAAKFDEVEKNLQQIDPTLDNQRYVELKNTIHSLLGDRSYFDLALYHLGYRGKLYDYHHQPLPDIYEMLDLLSPSNEFTCIVHDRNKKPSPFDINLVDLVFKHLSVEESLLVDYLDTQGVTNSAVQHVINIQDLLKFSIDQNSYDEFKNFDDLICIFEPFFRLISQSKHETFIKNQRIKSNLKVITEPHLLQFKYRNLNKVFNLVV